MARLLKIILVILSFQISLYSQQNSTLFFMPNTPQANFVNPAITNDCKLIIGIPVLSSVHINGGNSGFSFNQVMKKQDADTYYFDGNSVVRNLSRVNYFDTELHTNLLFIGYWFKNNYLTFTVNEKADVFLTYPRDLFAIAWNGNTQFEGKTAKLGRAGGFLNYRREYAFGIARQTKSKIWWGLRGKLLFGKLNTSFSKSKVDLFTDPITFDLTFNSDWQMNTSLPFTLINNPSGSIRTLRYNEPSPGEILFNRKNLGFSADFGFVKKINDEVTLSGSILDLGFISWKDNGYAFKQNGSYTYSGPLGNPMDSQDYIENLTRVIHEEFGITASSRTYIEMLNPRIYLGATYIIGNDLTAGILGTSKINRFKITSGITLSLNKQFSEKFSGSVSYSYLYKDFKNIGVGFKTGKSPLQFYMVTDNVLGFINPMGARNVNLRFGLQLNFGCDNAEKKFGGCGCSGMEQSAKQRDRLNKLLKRKN